MTPPTPPEERERVRRWTEAICEECGQPVEVGKGGWACGNGHHNGNAEWEAVEVIALPDLVAVLRECPKDLKTDAYACGWNGAMDDLLARLKAAGIDLHTTEGEG